ncbi:MAG TPA: hypothetical protein VJ464_01745 [Blastocatellia bacterium]|nr:hypothetical protein [Blastocatellia bacterium]
MNDEELASRVIIQPDSTDAGIVGLCAFYASMNLYVLLGLEPPPLERMLDLAPAVGDDGGLSVFGQMMLLSELNFPGLVGLGVIPHGQTARDTLPPLLDAGARLLLGIQFTSEVNPDWAARQGDPQLAGVPFESSHVLVGYGWSDEGVKAIVGWSYQRIACMRWKAVPFYHWGRLPLPGVALHREFVMVWPNLQKGGQG